MAGLVLGLLAVMTAPAAPASAHAALQSSDPTADTVLPQPPSQLTLTFTEPMQLLQDTIHVLAPDGSRADQGPPALSGTTVTLALNGQARGTYSVTYRVMSGDSHPVAGTFAYSVGAPSAAATAAGTDTDPVVRAAVGVVKFIGYAGLLLLVGPVMVLVLLWPQRLSRRRPAAVAWTGLGLLIASTLAGLWLQAAYLFGTTLPDVTLHHLREVVASTFGALMLVRLAALCAAGFLLRPVLGGGGASRVTLAPLVVLGVAAGATWPLTGHPSASPLPVVSVAADAVHLAAMAVWLGGLVMLVLFLLPKATEAELGTVLPIWSRWAATAVFVLVMAGATQALIEVGSVDGLFTTTYGRLIIGKIALVAAVITLAAFARRFVARGDAARGPARLRQGVWAELGITAVVLSLAAVLVQTPPARTATAAPPIPQGTTVMLKNDALTVQVGVLPAKVGTNSLRLHAYTPDSKPLPVVEWVATATPVADGATPVDVPLLRITDNHTIGDVTLPMAGTWQLTVTVSTPERERSTVTGTITIG